ncbi:hypothetical protein C9374_011898 [Naegleria lovaniensis]|uniref:BD-FAE-like domain-containing protein n=1 Tax=Naegleria lovaniensis TaxID=51637 RepID=A0AA88KEC4_NAELO|nr:uncharacterized protein C9374_011898 [Naegleria lovaniensis]KAG2373609.1 hypothetical protein C9374_011898 [Naegleria lovaniensis]
MFSLSWLYRKYCELLIILDIIWYQIQHIPWFFRNEFHVFQDTTTNHHEFHSSSCVKFSKTTRMLNVVRNFMFHWVRAVFGASPQTSKDSENNFILNYGMRYAEQRERQTLNEYIPMKVRQENLAGKKFGTCRVVIFLHGGTWHSGHADLYHNFSKFVCQKNGYLCYNLNYTLFPKGHLEEMIEDVDRGIDFVMKRAKLLIEEPEFVLVGHSAGAHLFSCVFMNKISKSIEYESTDWNIHQVKKLVLLCGVYDMVTHYEYEKKRQVHIISPMWKVCKGTQRFSQFSPSVIIDFLKKEKGDQDLKILFSQWPHTVIAHGKKDITCPYIQSESFYQKLSDLSKNVQFYLLESFYHGDLITNFMGIENDTEKRDQIWNLIISQVETE